MRKRTAPQSVPAAVRLANPSAFQARIEDVIDKVTSGCLSPAEAATALRGLGLLIRQAEIMARYNVPSPILGNKAAA